MLRENWTISTGDYFTRSIGTQYPIFGVEAGITWRVIIVILSKIIQNLFFGVSRQSWPFTS